MIIDMPTSATALAGMEMSKQFEKIMIVTDAASSDITGKSCSPYTAHWTYDTYANAQTVGSAIVKKGGDTWYLHHRRLSVRPFDRARHRRRRARRRRQGARQRQGIR